MENERKRLAQEFVDEVMSGKYPNIEIDENGYIDHYGIKYKLRVYEERIFVIQKTTVWDWLGGLLLVLVAIFLFRGRFSHNLIVVSQCWSILLLITYHSLMSVVKRIRFQRYIEGKFRRLKNQNSD